MRVQVYASELPREDGLPVGRYVLRHSSASYETVGFGYVFAGGETVEPPAPHALNRLLASHGTDFLLFADNDETAASVARFLRGQGKLSRADEIEAALTAPSTSDETPGKAAEADQTQDTKPAQKKAGK